MVLDEEGPNRKEEILMASFIRILTFLWMLNAMILVVSGIGIFDTSQTAMDSNTINVFGSDAFKNSADTAKTTSSGVAGLPEVAFQFIGGAIGWMIFFTTFLFNTIVINQAGVIMAEFLPNTTFSGIIINVLMSPIALAAGFWVYSQFTGKAID